MKFETYQIMIYVWMGIAAAVFLILLKITAPYGRHASSGWGPQISNRLGWMIMEMPSVLLVSYFMLSNLSRQNAMTWLLAGLYIFHYINRTFVFPFRIHTRGKKMPLVIVAMAFMFNVANGFFIGYYLGHFATYTGDSLFRLTSVTGLLLFISGMFINWKYDQKLIQLRKPGDTGYVIPEGGLFRYVSCPNLLGEIIEWLGDAVLCWNLPAFSFLVWTLANLVPRALSHHRWYRQRFDNYPVTRKAVFPFLL